MTTITVPFNPKEAATADLLAGLTQGFNFALYDMDAVRELIKRGYEADLLVLCDQTTTRKTAKSVIRRLLKIGGA